MLKGINKNVIVVRTDRKSRFEAAYFVLRRGVPFEKNDVLKEANRIIRDSGLSERAKRQKNIRRIVILCFLSMALGIAAASALWLSLLL